MKIKPWLGMMVLGVFASSAPAQVICQGVQYQFGPNHDVYYGGTNPAFLNNPNPDTPPGLIAAPPGGGAGAGSPMPNPAAGYGSGSQLYSLPSGSAPSLPVVFSDQLPYQVASQYGYTPDDARNEAYANVPRIQHGAGGIRRASDTAGNAPAPEPASTVTVDPRIKAIPLLSWAKAERTRNPDLYKALVTEARKYDPAATQKLEQSVASEK